MHCTRVVVCEQECTRVVVCEQECTRVVVCGLYVCRMLKYHTMHYTNYSRVSMHTRGQVFGWSVQWFVSL